MKCESNKHRVHSYGYLPTARTYYTELGLNFFSSPAQFVSPVILLYRANSKISIIYLYTKFNAKGHYFQFNNDLAIGIVHFTHQKYKLSAYRINVMNFSFYFIFYFSFYFEVRNKLNNFSCPLN